MSTTLDEAAPRAYPTRGGAALAPARRPAPRPEPVEEPRHLRVVRQSERARRRITPKTGAALTLLLFVTLFAVATAHTVLVQGQIRLDDLDAQLTSEQARYRELRTEVAEMESPSRIVAAAEALGMVAPDDLVYLQPGADPVTDPVEPRPSTHGAGSAVRTEDGDTTDTGTGSNDWAVMKPLLEAAAP